MTGANVLYNTHKGTSYALLDFNSLQKDNTQLQVFTNNKRIIERYKSPYEITSDRKNVNVKFRISKYLIAVMLALPLSKGLCAIVLSKDRRVYWKHKKEVIQKPPKVPLDKVIFKENFYESTKKIFSAWRGISYTKQLAFEGRKSYERPSTKCKKPVNYRVIYRNYKETELTLGTKKMELFAKCKIRGLKSNMDK
ncbi:unnamed protein product [Rhizophagus irregularis]|nr:unnamed protein product [Rhizophagus irregularis]